MAKQQSRSQGIAAWHDAYNPGDPLIDIHHQVFFELVRDLVNAQKTGAAKPDAHEVLLFLIDYIDMHFMAEEKLMASIEYPDRETHIQLHRQFTQRLDDLHKQLQLTPSPLRLEALLNLAQSWFKHILEEDQKLKGWVK